MAIDRKYLKIVFSIVGGLILIVVVYSLVMTGDDDNVDRDYPEIAEEGNLNIVTDYNSVGYYVAGDSVAGFNYEMAKLLQRYTSLKINLFVETRLDKAIDGLKRGQYDVIARNIQTTSDLRNSVSFTDVIMQNRLVLVQRKKEYNFDREPVRSHLDLAGKKLYVPLNSPAVLRIRNLSHEIGDTIYCVQDSLYGAEQLMMKVAAREIDYAVCDEKGVRKIASQLPEIDYKTFIGFTHFEAWGVRENSAELLDSLNLWISKIKKTSDYELLYQKYYK